MLKNGDMIKSHQLYKDLYSEFTVKDDLIDSKNKYIDMLKNSNSVSIHVRRGRFFEPKEFSNRGSMPVKEINLKDVFDYIYKSISFFEKNTINPKFFVWSNDFTDLEKFFKMLLYLCLITDCKLFSILFLREM